MTRKTRQTLLLIDNLISEGNAKTLLITEPKTDEVIEFVAKGYQESFEPKIDQDQIIDSWTIEIDMPTDIGLNLNPFPKIQEIKTGKIIEINGLPPKFYDGID